MEKRLIFPVLMFVAAGSSFVFGIWQYVYAYQTRASAAGRMAYIMTTLEQSSLARSEKHQLYARIMDGLPLAPTFLGVDWSGSFASQGGSDQCVSEGQRAICDALVQSHADKNTMTAICGVCLPIH